MRFGLEDISIITIITTIFLDIIYSLRHQVTRNSLSQL